MKITLSLDETELTATLVDSETTRDFLSLLPLRLTLSDYAETEKISDLPRRLSTADAPEGVDPMPVTSPTSARGATSRSSTATSTTRPGSSSSAASIPASRRWHR